MCRRVSVACLWFNLSMQTRLMATVDVNESRNSLAFFFIFSHVGEINVSFCPTHSHWLYNHVSMCMSGARVQTYTDFFFFLNNLRWYNILVRLNHTAASIITDIASPIVGHFIRLLNSWWSVAHPRAVDQLEERPVTSQRSTTVPCELHCGCMCTIHPLDLFKRCLPSQVWSLVLESVAAPFLLLRPYPDPRD